MNSKEKRRHPLFELNSGNSIVWKRTSFADNYDRTEEEKETMRMILETARFVPIKSKKESLIMQRARRSDW